MAGVRQDRDRHPEDGAGGAGRAVQHARPGPLLHRAHGRRLRRLPGRPRRLPSRRRACSSEAAAPRASAPSGSTAGLPADVHVRRLATSSSTLGPDGLVVNTAKYLDGQPLLAFNPDPDRIDGVLLPFDVRDAAPRPSPAALEDDCPPSRRSPMAQAELNDGQRAPGGQRPVHRPEDARLGPLPADARGPRGGPVLERDHRLDRRRLDRLVPLGPHRGRWASSRRHAQSLPAATPGRCLPLRRLGASCLVFSVREPFASRTSGARSSTARSPATVPLEPRLPDAPERRHLQRRRRGGLPRLQQRRHRPIGLADRKLHLVLPPREAHAHADGAGSAGDDGA